MNLIPYSWLRALHVAAVLVFVGGLLGIGVFFSALGPDAASSAEQLRLIAGLRRWDGRVTTPALLAVWALGLTLALEGGHFRSIWLPAKLAFVLFLSGVHSVQSGTLRRLAGGAPHRLAMPAILTAVLLSLGLIVELAVVKPF